LDDLQGTVYPHKCGHPSAAGRTQDRESSPVKDRRSTNCATQPTQVSSYLGSGHMTEVIRLALYTEVVGLWDGDCAGGRLLSTDTGLADLLTLGVLITKHLRSVDYFMVLLLHVYP